MLRGYVGRDTQQSYETPRMELTGYASLVKRFINGLLLSHEAKRWAA
jgi:hypothetical protein